MTVASLESALAGMSVTSITAESDLEDREAVYAAEARLPAYDRQMAMSDEQATRMATEHVGQTVEIIRSEGAGRSLYGRWVDLRGQKVPCLWAPLNYGLSTYEVCHEAAHLICDEDGTMKGHGKQFVKTYLGLLPPSLRLHLAEQLVKAGHGKTASTSVPSPLYHGTNVVLHPGDTLRPARSSGQQVHDDDISCYYDSSVVYMSTGDHLAERYALSAVKALGGEPHVYEVRPIGPCYPDPESQSGFGTDQWCVTLGEIVREVPLPGLTHLENGVVMRGPAKTSAKSAGAKGDLPEGLSLRVEYKTVEGWVVASVDGHDVGVLRWDYAIHDEDAVPTVIDISVDEEYQRRGIASAMFEFAKARESKLQHSDVLTDEGKAWRQHLGGPSSGLVPFHTFPVVRPNTYGPRDVELFRPARDDLDDLSRADRKAAYRAIELLKAGRIRIEPKERAPLIGAFTIRATSSLRIAFYLSTDDDWHIFWIGNHNYEEAERRFWGNPDILKAAARTDSGSVSDESAGSNPRFKTVDCKGQKVRLFDDYDKVGAYVAWDDGSGEVRYILQGVLSWFTGRQKNDGSNMDGGVIFGVEVRPSYRRMGLASAMLAFARERHPEQNVRHSNALSEDGKGWSGKVAIKMPVRFFHGSDANFKPGDVLRPGSEVGRSNHRMSQPDKVYIHPDPGLARVWAEEFHGENGRVYEVQPHDDLTCSWSSAPAGDPWSSEFTASAATVLRQVPNDEIDRLTHQIEEHGHLAAKVAMPVGPPPAGVRYLFTSNSRGNRNPKQTFCILGAVLDGQVIGYLTWGIQGRKVQEIWVDPVHRRRRIAETLFAVAKDFDPAITHHVDRSDAGDAWARATSHDAPVRENNTVEDDEYPDKPSWTLTDRILGDRADIIDLTPGAMRAAAHTALYFMHDVNEPKIDDKPMPGYEEKRSFDFIHPQIATGGALQYRSDVRILARRGVTGIVSGRSDFDDAELLKGQNLNIDTLYLNTPDDGNRKPTAWFKAAINFCLPKLRSGQKVYIHCMAGQNRGPSLAYGVLRAYTGMSHDEAMHAIVSNRPIALVGYADDADRALVELGYVKERDEGIDIKFRTLTGAKTASYYHRAPVSARGSLTSAMNTELSGFQQMPMADFRNLISNDFNELVGDTLLHLQQAYDAGVKAVGSRPSDLINYGVHEKDALYRGPRRYINHLKKDIAQHGLRKPLVVRGDTLFGGHHRAVAIMELGFDQVPVVNWATHGSLTTTASVGEDVQAWQEAEMMMPHSRKFSGEQFETFVRTVLHAELGNITIHFDLLFAPRLNNGTMAEASWVNEDGGFAYVGWSVDGLNEWIALHECAHVIDQHGGYDDGHGPKWRQTFRQLLSKYQTGTKTLIGSKTAAVRPKSHAKPLYRGLAFEVDDEELDEWFDIDIPVDQRAQKVSKAVWKENSNGGLGRHWTTKKAVAQEFASVVDGPNMINIVLTIAAVDEEHFEEDPDILENHGVCSDYGDENEITLMPGSPVRLTAIQWEWSWRNQWESFRFPGGLSSQSSGRRVKTAAEFVDPEFATPEPQYGWHTFTGVNALWGKNSWRAMFGDGLTTITPWPFHIFGPKHPLSKEAVAAVLRNPGAHRAQFDPRQLKSTQPGLTRSGISYYLHDPTYATTGRTFADQDNEGNRIPCIYVTTDGKQIILSGHHRAAAALLKGEMLTGLRVDEPANEKTGTLCDADSVGRSAHRVGHDALRRLARGAEGDQVRWGGGAAGGSLRGGRQDADRAGHRGAGQTGQASLRQDGVHAAGRVTASAIPPGALTFRVTPSPDDPAETMVRAYVMDLDVGLLSFDTQTGEIGVVWVPSTHRRQGIATALLARAREINPDVHHSDWLSPEGEGWSSKVGAVSRGLVFEVHDPTGYDFTTVCAYLNDAHSDMTFVGELIFDTHTGQIVRIEVEPKYRRRGIASALLVQARKVNPGVHHADEQSADGKAWSTKVASTGLTFEVEHPSKGNPDVEIMAYKDGKWAGFLSFLPATGEIYRVEVFYWYQRQGIATAMLAHARTIDPRVHHSNNLSADGRAWADKVARAADNGVTIEVHDKDDLDCTVLARHGSTVVAALRGGKWNSVDRVFVLPSYRRQGIATRLYERLELEVGVQMRRPDEFTDQGAAWYSSVIGKDYHSTWGSEQDWSGWLRTLGREPMLMAASVSNTLRVTASNTQQYVNMLADLRRGKGRTLQGDKYDSFDDLIAQEGKHYPRVATPGQFRSGNYERGELGMCFMNAANLAFDNPRLTYVEGYANMGVMAMNHAWCVNSNGLVYDPTWRDGSDYFGVPVPTSWLRSHIFGSEIWGLFAGEPGKGGANHNLLKTGIPKTGAKTASVREVHVQDLRAGDLVEVSSGDWREIVGPSHSEDTPWGKMWLYQYRLKNGIGIGDGPHTPEGFPVKVQRGMTATAEITMRGKPLVMSEVDITSMSTTRAVVAYIKMKDGDSWYPWSAGVLTWDRTSASIELVFVQDDMRRKGLATALLKFARTIEPDLWHSTERSPDGTAWAKSLTSDLPPNKHPLSSADANAMGSRLMVGLNANFGPEQVIGTVVTAGMTGKHTASGMVFWHVTDDAGFTINPEHKARGGQEAGDSFRHQPGLWITPNPELWHYLWRPLGAVYAAEIDVSGLREGTDYQQEGADDRDQWSMSSEAATKAKVKRVVPIKTAETEARRKGFGFALLAHDAIDRQRICVIDHRKGWGNPQALCNGVTDGGEPIAWTTVKAVATGPLGQLRGFCDICLAKVKKISRTGAVTAGAKARMVPIATVKNWLSADAVNEDRSANLPVHTILDAKRAKPGYQDLLADIKANGVREPLLQDPKNDLLYQGHTRLAAAEDAGLTEVPVLRKAFSGVTAGKNGDLPEGMTLRFSDSDSWPMGGVVTAWVPRPDGYEFAPRAGETSKDLRIGELSWGPSGKIGWVNVYEDEHQRRGVASAMLDYARTIRPGIKHSDGLNESSRPWARHTGSLPSGYTMEVHERPKAGYDFMVTVLVFHDGKVIAALGLNKGKDQRPKHDGPMFDVEAIQVYDEHQRQGIASEMYAEIHRRYPGIPVMHSWGPAQSGDARALTEVLRKTYGPYMHLGKTASGKEFWEMTPEQFEAAGPWVWHSATYPDDRDTLIREGVQMSNVPQNLARQRFQSGEYAEFAPGAGIGQGLYVIKKAWQACGYGHYVFAIKATESEMAVPPESNRSSVAAALGDHNGAIIVKDIPANRVHFIGRSYYEGQSDHWYVVFNALKEGKPVPEAIRALYPDMTKRLTAGLHESLTTVYDGGGGASDAPAPSARGDHMAVKEETVWVEIFYTDEETGKEAFSRRMQSRRGIERYVAKDVAAIEAEGLGPAVVYVRGVKFTPEGFQTMYADYLARNPQEA